MIKFMSAFAYEAWKKVHSHAVMDYTEYSTLVECWIHVFRCVSTFRSAESGIEVAKGLLGDLDKNLVPFHRTVRKILDRKVMFRTRQGKLGVGCRSLRKGDSIVFLAGCNLPMIIREAGQYWHVVSPAYLHKSMQRGPEWWSKQSSLHSFTFG
jgi:hypothetical protein